MNIAVIGARDPSFALGWDVANFVAQLPEGVTIVSGGAFGIDAIAETVWRWELQGSFRRICPEYAKYPYKIAPLKRNEAIAQACDELHAWPSPHSRGTWHCAKYAASIGKPVFIHQEDGTFHPFPLNSRTL